MKKNSIFKGAIVLAIGTFIAKLIGVLYRVPLTNILGGKGLGLYQMIFPVYAVLLDFAGAGVPNALSKIISGIDGENVQKESREYFMSSITLLSLLGILGSILMAVFSKPFARLQGNVSAYLGYITMSPAVFFVALISCFRGYFQGKLKMSPTAISQIVEQVVKVGLGLLFAKLFYPDIVASVAGATLAVSISELCALLYLLVIYKLYKRKLGIKTYSSVTNLKGRIIEIIKTAFPVTLVGIIIPLSQVIDSFLIINIISKYLANATALYGLFSGAVNSVINVPVSLCYGIAVVIIPIISKHKKKSEREKDTRKSLVMTFTISFAFYVACYLLAPYIVKILFSRLNETESLITINLLKITSVDIVLLSLLQTLNAILVARGKVYSPVVSLTIGVVVKIIVSIILLPNPKFNIYAGAIAVIACYFVSVLINLIRIFSRSDTYENKRVKIRQYQG